MPPPNPLNLFETVQAESSSGLHDRLQELETRNLHLQTLVVELLDKNEQLRRRILQADSGGSAQ